MHMKASRHFLQSRCPRVPGALLGLAVISAGCVSSGAAVLSDFTLGNEGWGAVDGVSAAYGSAGTPFAVVYSSTGGNPGGNIAATDPSFDTFAFEAPAKFTGDQSLYYGGFLRFDLKVDLKTAPAWDEGVEVVLVGAGLTLVRDQGIVPPANWTGFAFGLTETGWHLDSPGGVAPTSAQFQDVLANLTRLRIIGEYANGVVETSYLDNVALVPEPGTVALATGLGLGAFAWLRRRR
jgi:hypothetical protein